MKESTSRAARQRATAFILQRAKAAAGPVLELFAGSGELTQSLREAGAEVVAVEPQAPPSRVAELARPDSLPLLREDPRALRLPRRFDLVLAVGSALRRPATLDDMEAIFATAAAHLGERGVFLLEMEGLAARLHPSERPVIDPRSGFALGVRADPSTGRALFAPHLVRRRGRGHGGVSRLSLLAVAPDDVIDRLRAVGLEPLELWGDYDEHPFGPDSPRLIATAGLARPG